MGSELLLGFCERWSRHVVEVSCGGPLAISRSLRGRFIKENMLRKERGDGKERA
jgi:hypothetical protein